MNLLTEYIQEKIYIRNLKKFELYLTLKNNLKNTKLLI